MYIRPQLSRKRTENREILSKEHSDDVELYHKTLDAGKDFEYDSSKISNLIDELSENDKISENDKTSILECLSSILDELEKEYDYDIQNTLADIEFSIKDRIEEIDDASEQREYEAFNAEKTIWKTESVNKDKLVANSWELYQQYCTLLENAKSDLSVLTKEATEQRNKIIERRGKGRREY